MPIDRSGPVPPYWQYLAETIIIPNSAPPNANLMNLINAGLRWIHIPTYQRGISWGTDEVAEFLKSDSVLLGNIILGQFPATSAHYPYLPSAIGHFHVLVDGLQRLAVGTALLALLHDDYLAPAPNRPDDAPAFSQLTALVQSRAAAYLHNDTEFQQHPRKAIRDQYKSLRQDLEAWIERQISTGKFGEMARDIVTTMTANQVAIDVYFNFPNQMALMNTFLGLNTVRVDLGPMDLLRANLVERATADGWTAQDIEDIENQFTEIFSRGDQPDSELLPFVKVVLDFVQRGRGSRIFPSWTSHLDKIEVDRFLQFVADMKSPATNPYVIEIRNCGTNPFAVLLGFYYFKLVSASQSPVFLTGGADDDPGLHHLLLACYRVLLDGRSIGRTREYATKCLDGDYATLEDLADAISSQYLSVPIASQVDQGWLRGALILADKNRAKRVFNAMLLPQKGQGYGGLFVPMTYGARSIHYQVDHLIPDSMRQANQPGYAESDGIRNFAPLPTNQNHVAKATSCSSKLQTNGLYDVLISGASTIHPYWVWLVKDHLPQYDPAAFDQQACLEVNAQPAIGDARLDKISAELLARL